MKSPAKFSVMALCLCTLLLAACDRNYKCVCMSGAKGKDTLVDQVKTTKLGSKGYKKTCADYEAKNPDLYDCHLE